MLFFVFLMIPRVCQKCPPEGLFDLLATRSPVALAGPRVLPASQGSCLQAAPQPHAQRGSPRTVSPLATPPWPPVHLPTRRSSRGAFVTYPSGLLDLPFPSPRPLLPLFLPRKRKHCVPSSVESENSDAEACAPSPAAARRPPAPPRTAPVFPEALSVAPARTKAPPQPHVCIRTPHWDGFAADTCSTQVPSQTHASVPVPVPSTGSLPTLVVCKTPCSFQALVRH